MQYTMYTYIKEEQQVCRDIIKNRKSNLENYIKVISENKNISRIVFLASGSSSNAVNSAKYYIEEMMDMEVDIKIPFLFSNYEKIYDKDALIIGVSQGGKSYSTIEAMNKVYDSGFKNSIVLTADLSSPIAQKAKNVIDIGCGEEKVGFVTKGFSSTVLTLMLMSVEGAYSLGKIDKDKYDMEIKKLEAAVDKIEDVIEKSDKWYENNKNELIKGERFLSIGYGASFGISLESYTKITETVRCPMTANELEEYMHGPYLELNKDHYVFFIQTKGKLEERMAALRNYMERYTSHCYTIFHGDTSQDSRTLAIDFDGDENICPLLYVIPFQVLSYRLAIDKGIDLSVSKFPDFDDVLKSKI